MFFEHAVTIWNPGEPGEGDKYGIPADIPARTVLYDGKADVQDSMNALKRVHDADASIQANAIVLMPERAKAIVELVKVGTTKVDTPLGTGLITGRRVMDYTLMIQL